MPNLRSRGRAGRVVSIRRKTSWIGGVDVATFTGLTFGIAALHASLNAAALALRPFTVIRVRGVLSVQSDQEVADEEGILGMGFAVVSDEASAIGVSAIPTPVTEQSSNLWFVYEEIPWSWRIVTSGAGGSVTHQAFDSKGMRKVEPGQDIVQVVENNSSAFGCEFSLDSRMLVKLH